ncbi:tautomerase family protein [Methylobacterium brachythecii]|uniref:Phenylpyruvate tautomerase PptA (4-oxalocrotonate tautomerase family) n=1 Tax=Methylobacterium brachythecii TaxID=1176177 RepID=A0A7W6F6Q7_9HYPH|nr:tautomerase family protein [Methylobacterium brachythecii]MBB3902677.1 phenylpyruvate tautomerase PptA (4-oxalocrotonate tautomerase family) [Methylobacterium brachythecii]GLS42522.1 putative tautomerase YusQ [Methylobacterium brachythecii]
MPLVRIAIPTGKDSAFAQMLSDAIQDAMIATIDVPPDDVFQVLTEHQAHMLRIDPGYLGVSRSSEAIIVEILMRSGRTDTQKRTLYRTIVANLEQRGGIRPQDVMIAIRENERIDWSFGEGEAQIAPK